MSSTDKQPPAETPPPPAPEAEAARASRLTTIVLLTSLVLVVLTAGVLGTVAVLMTKNPDSPLLGGRPPKQLALSIHFAPVKEAKPACPGEKGFLDAKMTCYILEEGVTVTAVQEIEALKLKSGYAVRIAFAPAFLPRMADLVNELYTDQRQLAVVHNLTVVAAPAVTQEMTGDSLMISGFTQEAAEELAARLRGPETAPTTAPEPASSPGTFTPPPGTPATPPPTTPTPQTAPATASPRAGDGGVDPKFATCAEAFENGYGGPYHKGRPEYDYYVDKDRNGVACNSGDL
ncbi:excalibur calcium-binding domain-containing protein [Nonomuraea sp. NPDC050310]|uniref:excalibur calcium-binding domain-containing protein n=1 Tax=Nonomuraea sp. NPDC050310 TaxID=3154935 RepID=UPI00340510CB